MNAGLCIRIIFLLVFLAGCCGMQGCLADPVAPSGQVSPLISPSVSLQKATPSPTVKTTIAPIHTKEPVIKPPVVQPSVVPSATQGPGLPEQRPTPTTASPTPLPETLVTSNPGDNESASTYFQWGLAFEDAGDYNASIAEFDRAIAREPYYADAWYHKALSYEKLGMWDDAYQAYRFLLTIDPGYPASVNNSDISSNSSFPHRPPPVSQSPMETPVIWIASGVGLAGLAVAGFILYGRRRGGWTLLPGESGVRQSSGMQHPFPDIDAITAEIVPHYTGDPDIVKAVLKIAVEIAREGREGKALGTAFILGDSDAVLERSRQLILNPLAGHSECERLITSMDMRENIKELALVDGAFVIRENGIVEAAGRYISIDTSNVKLPKGLGTRHVSVAAITQATKSLGIVVSESGGVVRVFSHGTVIAETM
jgi:hypothetical protein